MSDTQNRNPERTRRAILDAARGLLRESGTGVALGDIAVAAGVSKSGLLHHFPNRDALLLAVAADALTQLHEIVRHSVDLAENRPGKALRAYVRALSSNDQLVRDVFEVSGVWTALQHVPGVAELLEQDGHRWQELLAADGLDADRILLVRYAADGLAAAQQWDVTVDDVAIARARDVLLRMAEPGGELGGPPDGGPDTAPR
ncbi:TetR/AcrR family transcriptional regulator [Nakamurella leprariae]|uniref:TetR family transcriptional regulator n=1 Tax=Nakamurella leprariae TaxID=2803911 RepID=A0A938YG77_9ACTN|nr:TetR/AcrR family transcriptional regulator [Nakamurella leprariae]MBM9469309.1 TetR family transcriptional regulator [Nakamurella leprariae]